MKPRVLTRLGKAGSWLVLVLVVAACADDGDRILGEVNAFDPCAETFAPAEPASAAHNPVKSVSGIEHTCVITDAGRALCWGGKNHPAALGRGDCPGEAGLPGQVQGLTASVTDIAAGGDFSCAVQLGGALCWGENYAGQIGDGSTTPRGAPVAVSGLGMGVSRVAAGADHGCALLDAGSVQCWGDNSFGQLGDGSINQRSIPAPVSGLMDVQAIELGDQHSCSLDMLGNMKCWGNNVSGQIGDGTTDTRTAPVAVLSNVRAFSLGKAHTCALLNDFTVRCWGDNSRGQLGDGSTTNRLLPTTVTGLSNVTALVAGSDFSCAVAGVSDFYCWGRDVTRPSNNDSAAITAIGESKATSSAAKILSPIRLEAFYGRVFGLSAGLGSACAHTYAGQFCLGEGRAGQLGEGAYSEISDPGLILLRIATGWSRPFGVRGLSRPIWGLSAGRAHTCALSGPGTPLCWGSNVDGEVGNGVLGGNQLTPGSVSTLSAGLVDISAGGDNFGEGHSCAVHFFTGTVVCWGENRYGQLRDGTNINRATPVAAVGLSGPASRVDAGPYKTCVALRDGSAECWGETFMRSEPPVAMVGLSNVIDVGVGEFHQCALLANGKVFCQGNGGNGQLGHGSNAHSATPVEVVGVNDAIALSTGALHNCLLTQAGAVKCWGENGRGQLGNGGIANQNIAATVSGMAAGITAMDAGDYHSCAVGSNGVLQCWGDNDFGQLGNNSTIDSLVPVAVTGMGSDAVDVTTGWKHTCAVLRDGEIRCWGNNDNGQIGDNTTDPRLTPVALNFPINTPPVVTYLASPVHALGTSGAQTVSGFASINPGPGMESGQTVLFGTVVNDPDSIVSPGSVTLDSSGTLNYTLTGTEGAAVVSVTPRDNGGFYRGGSDRGEPHEFRIYVGPGADLQMSRSERCGSIDQYAFGKYCLNIPRFEPLELDYSFQIGNRATFDLNGLGLSVNYSFDNAAAPSKGPPPTLSWTCSTPSGACSPASGTGPVNAQFNLAKDEVATVRVTGMLDASMRFLDIDAQASLPPGIPGYLKQDDVAKIAVPGTSGAVFRGGFE